ncbi:ferrochelatase 2 [Perilla frutescens var. hirtella]|uniref:Ferrochelatase n=1 Tax=Perilla frutescens var. hirtella TaxID=608512 RepID=A0AAD4P3M3_PERFH|nr:ferrochelatase 2 [Perilla frutescens var. hirtella]
MNQSSMNIRIQAPSPSLLPPRAKVCSQGPCPCVRVQLETFSNPNLFKTSVVARCSLGWSKTPSIFAEQSIKHSTRPGALVTSGSQETSTPALVGNEKIGVLLLNLGGPETLDDVQPFLFNLFADPDIIRLPRLFRFLQKPLAQFISVARSPKSKEGYASIGGGSPLRRITDAQAEELRKALCDKNVPANVYVGMRYWHPFTEEAIEQIKRDGITRLVVLPLYPQFSISTSGSSLRLLESIFREDEYLVNMQHTVIPSWYQREGYIKAMADLIQKELENFDCPEEVMIFFSAHGVPLAYVEEAGDPYKAEMEECVDLIMEELENRRINNAYTLAYQSRVGPVEWLKPYTDDTIIELGQKGVKSLLAVPISFVSEHIETLEEMDVEYKELALKSGIQKWGRVPALGCEPTFILDLADAVIESLPYVGAMAVSNLEARQSLVPLGSVEELLAAYDSQRRELPPPVVVWEWGWTKSAETWNGRAAMLAVLVLLVLEVTTGQGFLHQWGVLPLVRPLDISGASAAKFRACRTWFAPCGMRKSGNEEVGKLFEDGIAYKQWEVPVSFFGFN